MMTKFGTHLWKKIFFFEVRSMDSCEALNLVERGFVVLSLNGKISRIDKWHRAKPYISPPLDALMCALRPSCMKALECCWFVIAALLKSSLAIISIPSLVVDSTFQPLVFMKEHVKVHKRGRLETVGVAYT